VSESSIDSLQRDFKKIFKPFLQKLNGLRSKYYDELGKDLYEATITDAAQQLEKEIKK